MTRRAFILGTFALGACAARTPRLGYRDGPALPEFRLDFDAPFEIWARHLHMPTMRGTPWILVLSGGGEDGAFGAGVLTGWSEAGTRPRFDLVTGVSTGALMAPFAFLGSAHDDRLRQIYTAYGKDDILRGRGPFGLLDDALASSAPMKRLIDAYLPDDVIADVARAHRNDRRLMVLTSNLDSGQGVVWDMGAIASAEQADLFRGVTLASASIPGLFPPVTLDLGGIREAHVDGGVNLQLLGPPEAAFEDIRSARGRGGHLYVLVNNMLDAAPQAVPRRSIAIMQQTFTTMVRSQTASGAASARQFAERAGLDFSLATIGRDFDVPFDPSNRFDPVYMGALFRYGYAQARAERAWMA